MRALYEGGIDILQCDFVEDSTKIREAESRTTVGDRNMQRYPKLVPRMNPPTIERAR